MYSPGISDSTGCNAGAKSAASESEQWRPFRVNAIAKSVVLTASVILLLSLAACAPEVGSDKWCANLKEKPKGDWTANEAADYAKHCLFK
jgi:hypothetical protein